MRTRNCMSHRFVTTIFIVSLGGCASGNYAALRARHDEPSGRAAVEYVTPCYVSRTFSPSGIPIKKEGPQPNLVRFVDGGVASLKDADACFELTAAGEVKRMPGSCPATRVVSPDMCEDK
jgi:hypothetical protein